MAFELKKILSNRIIIVFFTLIIVASFVFHSRGYGTFRKYDPEHSGTTQEYIDNYNKQSVSVINTSKRIKAESGNIYTQRLCDKIIAQRENRRDLPLGDKSALINFTLMQNGSSYMSLMLVLFCALISAELFCGEIRTDAFKLNFTSKNGRLCLYKNKILALMLCAACAAIAYTATQLAAVIPFGTPHINAPIQVVEEYANCAYNIGFLQFIFAVTGMRILSCLFVCLLTVCLAELFGSLIASATGSTAVCVLLFVMYNLTLYVRGGTEISASKFYLHHNLLKFSPICLMNGNGYFVSSDYVNVLNFPVTELFFNVIVTTLIIAALTVLGAYLFSRKRRRLP